MQQVFTVSEARLQEMKNSYQTSSVNPPAGAVFRAHKNGVTITGYRSGKVMFQGGDIAKELTRWHLSSTTGSTSGKKSKQPTNSLSLPANFASLSVAGSDEVGTGSYFGPLTVAATYVDATNVDRVTALGIQDSKKLTDPQIIKMAKELLTFIPYHVVNLMPPRYNELMKRYNQAELKALCHNLALQKLLTKIEPQKPDAILVDQFVAPNTYFRYLKKQQMVVSENIFFRVRAEQIHVSVAAASIIARYVSLKAMDELTAEAGMTLPIGANSAIDQIAAKLIRQGQDLGQYAKLHFQNTQKAEKIANE